MINYDLIELFPEIVETVRSVEADPRINLDLLPWADIANELPLCYCWRDGRWQLDDDTIYVLPSSSEAEQQSNPRTHRTKEDEEPYVSGVQVLLTASDDTATCIRLIIAASLHIDTLTDAVAPSHRDNYRRFLVGSLVYAMAWMCRREASEQLQNVIEPALREQIQQQTLIELQTLMRNMPHSTPVPQFRWMESANPRWARITDVAVRSNHVREIETKLQHLCHEGTAGEMVKELRFRVMMDEIDLGCANKKQIYDEIDQLFGPIHFKLRNFQSAFASKKRTALGGLL